MIPGSQGNQQPSSGSSVSLVDYLFSVGDNTNRTITYPTASVSGDFMILCIENYSSSGAYFSDPAGWTAIAGTSSTTGKHSAYYKTRSSETSLAIDKGGDSYTAIVMAFRGVNATPIDHSATSTTAGASFAGFSFSNSATSTANAMLLSFVGYVNAQTIGMNTNASLSNRFYYIGSTSTGPGSTLLVEGGIIPSIGSGGTCSASSNSIKQGCRFISFPLRAA